MTDLFIAEIGRLRAQLSRSEDETSSLDNILGSILQDGLPGHIEMASVDYWCVKTMTVTYTDSNGIKRKWCQSGYHLNCFIPGGAQNIEVRFDVVGGAPVNQVDRGLPSMP